MIINKKKMMKKKKSKMLKNIISQKKKILKIKKIKILKKMKIPKNINFEMEMMNDEEIIDKILVEEFMKKYKDNKYYFDKIGLNEYLYNNIKIWAIIDKDGDINIINEENNEEYYLDDFIKLFHEEKQDDNDNYIKILKIKEWK